MQGRLGSDGYELRLFGRLHFHQALLTCVTSELIHGKRVRFNIEGDPCLMVTQLVDWTAGLCIDVKGSCVQPRCQMGGDLCKAHPAETVAMR